MVINRSLAFVDIETTGLSSMGEKIIEIAIHKVVDSQLVESYETLINPGCSISSFITELTGISNTNVKKAPQFSQVADRIRSMLKGCVFVAHSVEFDYSFVSAEFARCGIKYNPQKLCTASLSRFLYPQYPRHNLDHIIARHGFEVASRHRASDDALVLWKFYLQLFDHFDVPTIEKAIARQLVT